MLKSRSKNEASFLGISFAIVATIAARGSGFLREILMAKVFGTTADSDALIIALNIPTVMVSGFALAISTIYIPTYYRIKKEEGAEYKEIVGKLNTSLLLMLLVLGTVIIAIVEFFPEAVIRLFASGFDTETSSVCMMLLKVTIISTIPILFVGIFKAYGQIINRYALITFAGSIINIFLIIALVFVRSNIPVVLSYVSVFGYFVYMIITMVLIAGNGLFYFGKTVDFQSSYIREMGILFIPVFLSNIVTEVNQMVDKNFASTLSSGTISALNYSSKLINLVTAVFGTTISSVLFVKFSKLSVKGDKKELSNQIIKINSYLMAIVLPIFWIIYCFPQLIVKFIYGHGNFDAGSVMLTSECLMFYAFGIIGFNLKALWIRCFNASMDTKTPAINSSIAVILNIVMNFLLVGTLKHKGLAIATVTTSFVTDLLLIVRYKKVNSEFSVSKCLTEIMKLFIASIPYGIVFMLLKQVLESDLFPAIIEIAIGSIVASFMYYYVMRKFHCEAGLYISSQIKKFLKIVYEKD